MGKLGIVILMVLTISINLVAQENASLQNRKAQITFAYPIGSNGIEAPNYSNNFSFNILYGFNGGVNGFEFGSIMNYNKGKVNGFQLAGVSNVCLDSTSGFLLSGILNYSKQNSKGFQLSLINVAAAKFKGFQLSTINFTAEKFTGFQLGIVNYAKELNGIQLGVVNILLNDSGKAIPIGILNIVKNGFFEFELTGGEVIYSNLNYKMGVEKFYTIFKAGYSYDKNNPVYSYGMGFGSNISISEKHKLNIDLSSNSINNKWDDELDLLNKVDLNYKYNITKNLSLLVGPSFNVYIAKEKVGNRYGTLNIPYTIYKNEWTGGEIYMWIGFNAGLSFKI